MPTEFDLFLPAFFQIFEQSQFDGQTFLAYLEKDKSNRSGDEASVVDNVISGPLLSALGYSQGQQTYNAVKSDLSRPDFEPKTPETGVCFVVEDKSTSLDLTLDLDDKKSHLSQLAAYVRGASVALGLLCNGRELQLWEFGAKTQRQILRLDVPALLRLRAAKKPLGETQARALHDLFDLLRREAFTDAHNIAIELAVDAATWRQNATKLDGDPNHEAQLVEDLRKLVALLQRDARRQLDTHLDAVTDLNERKQWADDRAEMTAQHAIFEQRALVENALDLSLTKSDSASREAILTFAALYALDPRDLPSREFFVARALELHNQTALKPLKTLGDNANGALAKYAETVLSIYARRTRLEQKARLSIAVEKDFSEWQFLVSETMLGGMDKTERRAEFALQAAYVVFIRLLLIRVCEDKEIFPDRFLSNGGLLHWQEDIKRYLRFVRGNRYEPLLKMAYDNAANIYAHFFTGRELFNWYQLGETELLQALKRLAKYDFGEVDSDLLGTVYNAYVERHEKKKQGQYYTPRPIVDFILDEVGWREPADIIGENKRLIDPACGSGTFLVRAAKRLMDAYRNPQGGFANPKMVLERVRDKIYGFDLNPFACYLAEVNLLIQVLDAIRALAPHERLVRLERFHIYNVDSLARAGRGVLALGHDSLLAEELDAVERIKGRQDKYAPGFSHVVANPPYGARLSDDYKSGLKRDYPLVFRGQPDTYVFFYALGLELLGTGGRLGFITPNTFLMGTNTDFLRGELLRAGQIERIVDLPQGIWDDATVDCVLLFLRKSKGAGLAPSSNRGAKEKPRLEEGISGAGLAPSSNRGAKEKSRLEEGISGAGLAPSSNLGAKEKPRLEEGASPAPNPLTVEVNLMDLRDDLDKLSARAWAETLTQDQSAWQGDPAHAMDIRRDAIQTAIEAACLVQRKINQAEITTEVLRLGDVTDSSQGIIPYYTKAEGKANLYIKPRRDVPPGENDWKPLLDGSGYVGRYELRWGKDKPFIKYTKKLYTPNVPKYYDSPKILVQDMRNKSLERRLIGAYDESGFYNRHNFNNIISEDPNYDLKYILAIFNSRLLNYWYKRKFDNLHVNPSYFRQIPICPADAATQGEIVGLVDELLAVHRELNGWRERGYRIEASGHRVTVPFDVLLAELQKERPDLETLALPDAEALGLFTLDAGCNRNATLSDNVRIAPKFPTQITLKWKQLWLDVPDPDLRDFLLGLLGRPRFAGFRWSDLENDDSIRVPAREQDLDEFFNFAAHREDEIRYLLKEAHRLDQQIDERVLDLYGILDAAWRARIMDSAPASDADEAGETAE